MRVVLNLNTRSSLLAMEPYRSPGHPEPGFGPKSSSCEAQ